MFDHYAYRDPKPHNRKAPINVRLAGNDHRHYAGDAGGLTLFVSPGVAFSTAPGPNALRVLGGAFFARELFPFEDENGKS